MKTTRNQSLMAYVTLEDNTGSMELLVFSSTLNQYGSLIHEGGGCRCQRAHLHPRRQGSADGGEPCLGHW